MQMVKNIFIAIVVIWLSLVIFMPKSNLYYKLEEELAKQDIKLNEKMIEDRLFSLHIEGVDIYLKGIYMATIKEINLFTLLFYSDLSIEEIGLREPIKNMMPNGVEIVNISHSILSPLNLVVDANASLGSIKGLVDLGHRNIRISLDNIKNIAKIKSIVKIKKDKNGWYYETAF